MTALVRLSAEFPTLAAALKAYGDGMREGEAAWRKVCRSVAAVRDGFLWRDYAVPVGAGTAETRPCQSFAEFCEVFYEKTEAWGHERASEAAHSEISENPTQSRALAGLSHGEAIVIVAKATQGGTRSTTAAELKRLRAQEAIERGQRNKSDAKRKWQEREDADIERQAAKLLRKLYAAIRQHSGYPHWFIEAIERCRAYCEEQEKAGA